MVFDTKNHNGSDEPSYMDWHFVPRVNDNGPFATVICLIWTPSFELSINLQKGVALDVSTDTDQKTIVLFIDYPNEISIFRKGYNTKFSKSLHF